MSDTGDPLADADDRSQEERLLARLNGLIQYQDDLLNRVRGSRFRPYCHIPDFFDLDPEATRPYSVPSSFIPEQVGGNVSVTSASGGFIDNEPLDLMLSSFLPGGFKRRWKFDMWTGDFDSSSRYGFANLESGVRVRTSKSLSVILPEAQEERYTPYQHATEDVEVYIPSQFIVWNPTVDEQGSIAHYYWDQQNGVIRSYKPDDVPEESLRKLKSDPTSQFLWFKHLLDSGEDRGKLSLNPLTNGLFESATFSDNAKFLKAYYATLLTLYGEDQTFSEVVRYRYESDDSVAFAASREESQLILFESERERLENLAEREILRDDTLYRDLQFSLLYRLLWDRLFFQQDALDHAFSVRPFFTTLIAVDYSLAASSDELDSIFEADLETIKHVLPSVLPNEESRLGLLDFDEKQLDDYMTLIEEYWETVDSIIQSCRSEERVAEFATHVLVHSLKHGLASWAVEHSAGGSNFQAWYDINFQERHADHIQVGIYDSIQGGAGVSKEIFDDINEIEDLTLLNGIGRQGCCHISATEELVNDVLQNNTGEYIFDLVDSMTASTEDQNAELAEAFNQLDEDYRHIEYGDIQPLVLRRLASLAETQELARFYSVVAEEYEAVGEKLSRTPRPVDIVFALEDRTFFDTRVHQTYERFANRRSQRRDLSELAERVEEVTRQCIHACPDCLKRQSCTHQYRYQEEMLDRRLLTRAVSSLEEDSS
ncbi:hypothetical protein [Halalkalicoccus salilacus]|uniref:hypothetical protein n=1 Tax=Halalkalicoccus salilacus TaxID=3117459 RepID=UPI00300EDD51